MWEQCEKCEQCEQCKQRKLCKRCKVNSVYGVSSVSSFWRSATSISDGIFLVFKCFPKGRPGELRKIPKSSPTWLQNDLEAAESFHVQSLDSRQSFVCIDYNKNKTNHCMQEIQMLLSITLWLSITFINIMILVLQSYKVTKALTFV